MAVCAWACVHVNACMSMHVCSLAFVYVCMTYIILNRNCDIVVFSVMENALYADTVID